MATQVIGAGGTTTSFSNTPQAKDDLLTTAASGALLTEDLSGVIKLDVLANDSGGAAKTLWSVDDASGPVGTSTNGNTYPSDLLVKDVAYANDTTGLAGSLDFSAKGAKIWIGSDGYVHYDTSLVASQLQALGAGDSFTDTFTYAIKLGNGTLSWATATVRIAGTNDAPDIHLVTTDSAGASLIETNSALTKSGTLTVNDADVSDTVTASVTSVSLGGTAGGLNSAAVLGMLSVSPASLTANPGEAHNLGWTFNSAPQAFDFLAAGETLTLTYTIKADDGHTGTDTQTVTITITGTNDAAILSADVANLTEGNTAAAISTNGTLTISDVDSPATFVAQAATVGTYGTFAINAAGAWTYTASSAHNEFVDGQHYTENFDVVSADGTHTSVHIDILGTNDAAVLSSASVDLTEADTAAAISTNGTLTISDVDSPATFVAQAATVGTYGTFAINAAGAWTYTASSAHNEFVDGQHYTENFDVVSADGTHTSVHIDILGTNDAAILSADVRNLTETNSATDISTSGTLTISDIDSPQTFVAQLANVGTYGTFAINAAGAWTYTASSAHNEFVGGTTYTDTFDVVSADGTHTSVTVNILGTNDNGAPVAVADTNWAKEDTNTNATGNVLQTLVHVGAPSGTFSDHADTDPDADTLAVSALSGGIDNGATFTRTGTYGSLVITKATGAYTYTLANAQANVQALAAGQTVTDSFTYTVSDGHGGTSSANLAVTVFGTDEVTPGLITLVADGKQGSNSDPSTVTITFTTAVHTNFVNLSDVMHLSGLANATVINGSGFFVDATHYRFLVDKGTGSNNGSSYTLNIDSGAFSDTTGHTNGPVSQGNLKPAGTSGEPINLALTDPSHEGALITVTVKDVPSGWTIDGATHNADGSWTTQTSDLHGLTVTTPVSFTGAAVLDVQMTWTNADGTTGSASIADNVEAYAPGSPIFAWSGDDVLTGSSGNDLFVFSQPIGADTVHNFDATADQIDLIGYNGLAGFADLQTHIADDAHGNAVITLGDGQSITLDGVHSGALTAGNFVFDQTPVVNNAGTMTIGDGALLPLSGTINNSGLISLDSTGGETLLQIIQHGVTLQGGGQILLSDSAANVISGTGPDVTLVNVDNTISGAGQLGGGMLSLDNQGTIIATGANALVIDTGGSVVTNSGTLEATGSGGLTVTGGLANSGMLLANGGDIVIHGQVTGDGDATIGNLSKLEFGGASSTDVTFAHDAAGTLQLDDSFDFSGRIGGITNDDRLELEDILFGAGTTAVYQANQDGSGGTLTVSDGTHGTALHLVGSYDANGFKLADDGQGHTAVSYNPAEFTLTGVDNGGISSDFVV
ncbi:VCBS domain-containing protein [Mesorhizobium sp. M7A.F.Ca.US.008.03.1.1]|uniref:beta strand repeat-containing protein n=1 Tax=Mesorhizobium sp. M7A.F.Ca.US.008.03.1.1 TaxID=2496742 RepID=UPI000FCA4B15|nr:VCBS domain-containing protein [Mesorhizobium sp. M7A.F.Ca.US.008.03.1.1]RUW63878.1 adhesin [Mesorhizobium sp. M7A.F.Ca.US.008.03.1.1]